MIKNSFTFILFLFVLHLSLKGDESEVNIERCLAHAWAVPNFSTIFPLEVRPQIEGTFTLHLTDTPWQAGDRIALSCSTDRGEKELCSGRFQNGQFIVEAGNRRFPLDELLFMSSDGKAGEWTNFILNNVTQKSAAFVQIQPSPLEKKFAGGQTLACKKISGSKSYSCKLSGFRPREKLEVLFDAHGKYCHETVQTDQKGELILAFCTGLPGEPSEVMTLRFRDSHDQKFAISCGGVDSIK